MNSYPFCLAARHERTIWTVHVFTESPIIPLYVRDLEKTFIVTAEAFKNGVFINSVIPPACAPQDTLVRFALMATHTNEQVDRAVAILTKIFKEQGIIK